MVFQWVPYAAGFDYEIVINVDDSANVGAINGGTAVGSAGFTNAELLIQPVPVPGALVLMLSALAGLAVQGRRKTQS